MQILLNSFSFAVMSTVTKFLRNMPTDLLKLLRIREILDFSHNRLFRIHHKYLYSLSKVDYFRMVSILFKGVNTFSKKKTFLFVVAIRWIFMGIRKIYFDKKFIGVLFFYSYLSFWNNPQFVTFFILFP